MDRGVGVGVGAVLAGQANSPAWARPRARPALRETWTCNPSRGKRAPPSFVRTGERASWAVERREHQRCPGSEGARARASSYRRVAPVLGSSSISELSFGSVSFDKKAPFSLDRHRRFFVLSDGELCDACAAARRTGCELAAGFVSLSLYVSPSSIDPTNLPSIRFATIDSPLESAILPFHSRSRLHLSLSRTPPPLLEPERRHPFTPFFPPVAPCRRASETHKQARPQKRTTTRQGGTPPLHQSPD